MDKTFENCSNRVPNWVSLEVKLAAEGQHSRKLASNRNAELLRVLVERAHTCPVPLICDGRRLDALEQNPEHGWGPRSQPLMYGALEGDLPLFGVPPCTNSSEPAHLVHRHLSKGKSSEEWWSHRPKEVAVAFIVSAHIEFRQIGKSSRWEERSGLSRIYWVKDGVVVQSQDLHERRLCSVGVFLSADGLQTDLSGLKLTESKERKRRVQVARRMLKEPLQSASEWCCRSGVKAADNAQRVLGAVLIGFGTLGGAFSFIKPLMLIKSVGFLATGIYSWNKGDAHFRSLVEDIEEALRELPRKL
jgi:hypothetical protein